MFVNNNVEMTFVRLSEETSIIKVCSIADKSDGCFDCPGLLGLGFGVLPIDAKSI